MSAALAARMGAALMERQQQGLRRANSGFEVGTGREIEAAGQRYLNFAGNDYLGLARHPLVIRAWQQAAAHYGVGSGGSALVTGHSAAHRQLVDELCDFTGYPAALLFSSGFAANHGLLSSLLKPGDRLLQDRLNHASLLDGGLASGARMARFGHNDLASLARHLAKANAAEAATLVVSEGVFSMDGDGAPVAAMAALCRQHDASLLLDDAHGLGVTGDGRGALAAVSPSELPLYMATFGKACGVGGAFVASDAQTIDYLTNFCRHYIYTTAMPPAQAAAAQAAIRLIRHDAEPRQRLQALISRFRRGAAELGLPLMASASAIQPLLVGEVAATLQLAEALRARGLWAGAIRPPTVPAGQARLRITLSALHHEQDIDRLLDALNQCWRPQ